MNRVVNGKLVLKLKEIIDDETEVWSGTDDEYEVKWQKNLMQNVQEHFVRMNVKQKCRVVIYAMIMLLAHHIFVLY